MNTDVQVVKFANEQARTMADKLCRIIQDVQAWRALYAAQSIAAQITAAGASEVIDDGSATDGRTPLTGTSLVNMAAGGHVRGSVSAWGF